MPVPVNTFNCLPSPIQIRLLPWGRRTHACTYTHAYGYICSHICWGYANAWFDHYSPIHQIPRSPFHCTLIARLVSRSLSLSLWIPLYAHLAQHRPKCHTHAGIYCRATSVRTAPRLLAFARARVKVSQTLFLHFSCCCCCVAGDVRRLKQQKKKIKQQKSSESQTSLLGISIYNLVLHHVVLSCFFLSKFICSLLLPLLLLLLCPIPIHVVAAIS